MLEYLKKNKEEIFDILILSFLTILILYTVDFQSVFIDSVPEGGDYLFHFMKSSHMQTYTSPFQLNSWMESTYFGTPLFSSYPPLFFIITHLVSYIFPLNITFKFFSVIGIILLPLILYISIKKIRPNDSSSIISAIFLIPIVFHSDHFAYGLNIDSILVGEFCYTLAFVFFIPFIFFFFEGIKKKKYLILNITLLFLTCITHPVIAVFGFFMPLFFLFQKNLKENLIYLVKFYIPTIFLCLVWFGPYFQRITDVFGISSFFSSDGYKYGWPLDTLYSIFPKPLISLIILFSIILLIYIFKKNNKLKSAENYLLFGVTLSAIFFIFRPVGWAIRFLPLLYLFIILFLGFYLGRIINNLKENQYKFFKYLYKFRYVLIFFIFGLFVYMLFSYNLIEPMKNMANYQFKGQPNIPGWSDEKKILDFIKTLPYDSRILSKSIKPEVIYIFDKRGTINGMFIYSIAGDLSYPFEDPIEGDMENFSDEYKRKLDIFNVGYIITTKNISEYDNNSIELKAQFGEQQIFKIKSVSNSFVSKLPNKPYLVANAKMWKDMTFNEWFEQNGASYPLIAYSKSVGKKEKERFIIYNGTYKPDNSTFYNSDCFVNNNFSSGRVEIETNCIGQPLLVKVSYFSNWKVIGADRTYIVSPGFILIYPNQNHIVVYYGKTFFDSLFTISFLIGILIIILLSFKKIDMKTDNLLKSFFDFFYVNRIEEFFSNNKKLFSWTYRIFLVVILLFIFGIANIYYKFPHDITDAYQFEKAKINYNLGNYEKSIKIFESIKANKYDLDKQYYLSMLYFKQDNFEKAKDNLMGYISEAGNTEKSAELRYNYILALLKRDDEKTLLHEIHMIDISHPGSSWRAKAMNLFEEWKKTHEYDPADLH